MVGLERVLFCCCRGEEADGDELEDELEDLEDSVGEADDSVLTVVELFVSWGLDWIELFGGSFLLPVLGFDVWLLDALVDVVPVVVVVVERDFSRLGRICAETSDFLRKRSLRSLIELEKSLIVGF